MGLRKKDSPSGTKTATTLETIAGEIATKEKLFKKLVCLEKKTVDHLPYDYREQKKHLSTRFGVVYYDDKIIIPQALHRTIITLFYIKGTQHLTNCWPQQNRFGGRN